MCMQLMICSYAALQKQRAVITVHITVIEFELKWSFRLLHGKKMT